MDIEILFHSIMTDAKGSKSNIAAKFQNALNLQFLPPIGVFWDIENCQVPKGKSAIALVQNIREKFFARHREAEFMCVCDINKESKTVIQELILAQVTVVHISATSKNAADDKLKQCMRRFVDTHGSPSTLLLISDDVNFASDLSDFRHRHNIRIILLHRGHAHQSLLACAHEHYDFSIIAVDLPSRSPVKSSDNRPHELVVTDLPLNRNIGHIKSQLKKLSENCGGKVMYIRGSRAIMRFANAEAAVRAQRRMDKEVIFGNEICVTFRNRTDPELSDSPPRDQAKGSNSSNDASGSSSCSRDSSVSPPRESEQNCKKYTNNVSSLRKFDFPPPPLLSSHNCPSLLKNNNPSEGLSFQKCPKNNDIFTNMDVMETVKENKSFQLDWNSSRSLYHSNSKCQDVSAFSPFRKDQDLGLKAKYSQRNVGRVSPFVLPECDKAKNSHANSSESTAVRRNQNHSENASNAFSLYSNHGYSNLSQNITLPFNDIQRISDPILYSQYNGTSLQTESLHSVSRTNTVSSLDGASSSSIELHVSNLDPAFEVNEMKKILLSVFREHIMVLHISMSLQPDGSAKATVKVPSLQDAQFAISRLHRRKIGHKRILISHVSSDKSPPFHVLRSETVALLNDIPTKNLPLIKFRELYEKRYHRPIAVSELYKMRDAVTIQGDSGSRIVYLNADYCRTPSLPESEDSQEFNVIERPYCERHFHVSASQGWAEQYSICPLPLVHISLKALATAVHTLLDTHQGSLPLISFCDCYEAEVGPLPVVGSFESLQAKDDSSDPDSNDMSSIKGLKGVPLEHLIACVTGVEVAKSVLCIKKVQWLENKTDIQASQNFSPALVGQLTLFGREVMDLLKSQPQCLVPFNKFIPTYHHHFGRQCRVADYGFTKLIDLLEAIPHIVQVLGEGQNRQVTLTHRTQVKRFAAELLRILKSRASKQISVSEFSQAYEQVIEKPFEITNYGVCEIEDMLDEVPENIIVTSGSGNETMIGIPKREQTVEEMERTRQFAEEVVELMKHTPHCTMAFNKFIPAYHHHFGKQCRVADYGFTKLIELFEAIPDVLEVKGAGEDKILNLVVNKQHKILSERLVSVLKAQANESIDINQLSCAYTRMHGHALRPSDFGFTNLHQLLDKLNSSLRVVVGVGWTYVTLVDHKIICQISLNLRQILMEQYDGRLAIKDAYKIYQAHFDHVNLSLYFQDLTDVIKVKDGFMELTPLQLLARKMIILLRENGGLLHLSTFGSMYQQRFGDQICTAAYGFSSMPSLLETLSDYFSVKGKKQKRTVCLNPEMFGFPLPNISSNKITNSSSDINQRNVDILSQPVPSCVPSPNLEPHIRERLDDLMGFETPPSRGAASDFSSFSTCQNLGDETSISSKQDVIKSKTVPQKTENSLTVLADNVYSVNSTISNFSASPLSYCVDTKSHTSRCAQVSTGLFKESMHNFCKAAAAQIDTVIENSQGLTCRTVPQYEKIPVTIEDNTEEIKLSSNNSEDNLRISEFYEKSNSDQSISKRSKVDSHSFEDLTKYSDQLNETKDNNLPSTKSTPTRVNRQVNRRSRIAAQFSLPIND